MSATVEKFNAVSRRVGADVWLREDARRAALGRELRMSEAIWARVEVMGHRRHHGLIREATRYGAMGVEIEVYEGDAAAPAGRLFYAGPAIFSVAPMPESRCREAEAPFRPTAPALSWHAADEQEEAEVEDAASA